MKSYRAASRAGVLNLLLLSLLAVFFCSKLSAEPLYSPSWGFSLDLPEGYRYTNGDLKDRFNFQSSLGAGFSLVVYRSGLGANDSVKALAEDINKRLKNKAANAGADEAAKSAIKYFNYHGKKAAMIQLDFKTQTGAEMKGLALCIRLESMTHKDFDKGALLAALSYAPASEPGLQPFCLSALDSLVPSRGDRLYPGPVTEYLYPRGKAVPVSLSLASGAGKITVVSQIHENDAKGAQALVDREFGLLKFYQAGSSPDKLTPQLKAAWKRYYRLIHRDAFDRVAEIAFSLERQWQGGAYELAEKALAWVQNFKFERNLLGSDFVNLVSAAAENRGDCDSRAMLWAIIMEQADVPAAIMISPRYSHAMGLVNMPGEGARFPFKKGKWLVAETTAHVGLGRIAQNESDIGSWFGIDFEE